MGAKFINGGLNAQYAPPFVFDIETAAIRGAREYLETPTAPANYKDADKIAAYIEEKQAEQVNKAALDPDLTRIVCLGLQRDEDAAPVTMIAKDEDGERELLRAFWDHVGTPAATLIGFGILTYDVRVLLRRSLYLGVKPAHLAIDKYRHPGIVDLMDELSFHGAEKYHSLNFYIRRFGLGPFEDDITGDGIGLSVAVGDWDTVARHCRIDVQKETALAKRIGVLE